MRSPFAGGGKQSEEQELCAGRGSHWAAYAQEMGCDQSRMLHPGHAGALGVSSHVMGLALIQPRDQDAGAELGMAPRGSLLPLDAMEKAGIPA